MIHVGVVTEYDVDTGYGLILASNLDVFCFVARQDVNADSLPLKSSDTVQFNMIFGSRGRQAINVTKIHN